MRLLTKTLLACLAAIFFCSDAATAADRPNVLLILVDDLKPALGCYGDPVATTPNIDALAARGMRFELAYCNQAVCAPSRFTLMLGSHSTSTGLYGLGSQLRQVVPDAVTMPQHFARHGGYRTESLGKVFHFGHGNHGDPQSFSVKHFHDKVIEYLDPASTDGGQLTREEAYFTNQKLGQIKSLPRGAAFESPDVADTKYADGRVAAEAVKRLRAAKERREKDGTAFFITAGFARPHLPFSAPKKYWDLYDPASLPLPKFEELPKGAPPVAGKRGGEISNYKPVPTDRNARFSNELKRQLIHGYYASTSFVDAQIGKVIDELDRLKLADDTIVVLWGDHGFHLGDLGIWTKHTNYEQANRIPILISAPGVTKPGSSTKQPTESVDIFPTLAELAGLPEPNGPQPIDGVSLVPVLKNPHARVRDHAYHAYPKQKLGRAIRTERYRLVEWRGFTASPDSAEYELYDYQTDPLETENLAAKNPEVVAQLQEKLNRYPSPVQRNAKPGKAAPATSAPVAASPIITNRPLRIVAEVTSPTPRGVVLAQGGIENGYALHFVDGKPAFDVRIVGKVTRLIAKRPSRGSIRLRASLSRDQISLSVNGEPAITAPSAGLIPVQPKDGLSVGLDTRTAAGDYEAPNPFSGTILSTRVDAGGKPPAVAEVMGRKEIEAGLESHDRALFVKEGWIRDPYIVRGPDDFFYLTGTTPNPGDPREQSDPYNTGLGKESIVGWKAQVWRSKDLIDWEPLGTPFTLKHGIWYGENPKAFEEKKISQWRLWAPELHWLDEKKRWALVHTSPSPVRGANLSLTEGASVKGPWSNPMGTGIGHRHDPSLFKDDDGTWWLIWGATTIAPLKPDFSGFASEPTPIGPSGEMAKMGHEGCLIMKIHGKYVLFGTGWSTGLSRRGSYNLYYATADKITGPYSERKFAGRFLGHGTPFKDRQGRWWCTAFYNANIPPLRREGIESRNLRDTAQTINQRGTTLVPLDVRLLDNGELHIRATDPAYASPGPDEAQKFFTATDIAAKPPSWRYTFKRPADGWEKSGFNDRNWQQGVGGFGTHTTPGVRVNTEWSTKEIWLRRTFEFAEAPANPTLLVYHDEDAEIYLNGTRVASFKGFVSEYKTVPVAGTPVKAGKNLVAVHCRQTVGGQGIDVHLGSAERMARLKRAPKPIPKVTMRTPWGEKVTPENVWTEYPRPALRRKNWLNLNGHWDYVVTPKDAKTRKQWDGKILVPFAIEAPLSGVEKRFTPDDALWYRRFVTIAKKNPGRRYKLNFEAVDYKSTVWVNGRNIGSHTGGNLPFFFDVTDALKEGVNEIMLSVTDATDSAYQLHGKQRLTPKGIWYTPVSGIWQTVWMEEVPKTHVTGLKITPKIDGSVRIVTEFSGPAESTPVKVTASRNGKVVATAGGTAADLLLKIPDPELWSPDSPALYDLKVEFGDDVVASYVGLRETGRVRDDEGHLRFTLNGKPIFHWGTLDQGWWPDGLLTPPSDEAMLSDIEFLKAAGFNTIRKHIKIEPRRYYYHCDRLGMMVWQDHVSATRQDDPKWIRRLQPNPQTNTWPAEAHAQFMAELKGMIDGLYSHPCIVQWVPFNERWGQHQTMEVGRWTVQYDPTREVNIASGGNFFPVGHIADEHKYPHPEFPFDQGEGGRFDNFVKVMGEFGGHGFPVEGHLWSKTARNWGYGGLPKDKNEWLQRYRTSIKMLADLKKKGVAAGIYTQTTDVEGEINGLVTYDRKVQKIPPAQLAEIHRNAGL